MTKKPIALIGFYGSGKTTVARHIASQMEVPYCNLGDVIEQLSGMRINTLYETLGEGSMRDFERLALSSAAATGGVLATTGGCVMMPHNRRMLNDNFTTFFLDIPFEVAYANMGSSPRPSVESLTKEELGRLYHLRRPLYEETADHYIDGTLPLREIVDEIINLALADKAEPLQEAQTEE